MVKNVVACSWSVFFIVISWATGPQPYYYSQLLVPHSELEPQHVHIQTQGVFIKTWLHCERYYSYKITHSYFTGELNRFV